MPLSRTRLSRRDLLKRCLSSLARPAILAAKVAVGLRSDPSMSIRSVNRSVIRWFRERTMTGEGVAGRKGTRTYARREPEHSGRRDTTDGEKAEDLPDVAGLLRAGDSCAVDEGRA